MRENQKQLRMKQLRLWVCDPNTPKFRREAKKQAKLLRGAPEEADALDFIEKTMDRSDWSG